MCRPGGGCRPRNPIIQNNNNNNRVLPPSSSSSSRTPLQETGPLPLLRTAVTAQVVDFTAQVTLAQVFKNAESTPLEVVYDFPLSENFTICDFSAVIDGKVIKGECQEKEQAKDTYTDAIASGGGAYLLEKAEDKPDIFTVNVGNLPPGKEVEIRVQFVTELNFDAEGQLLFVLPSSKRDVNNTANTKPPPLTLKIDLNMTSNIKTLSSPSHPIAFEFGDEPNQANVTLNSSDSDTGDQGFKDFILKCKLAKPHAPIGRVSKDASGQLAAMVSLYPRLEIADDEDIYTEMIFLIDRSGSMSGSRINQVKDTLAIFLRSLGVGTMFNIVGFGSRTEFLFKNGSVEYNDKNLDIAVKHVTSLAANLGGTDILAPLTQIFNAKPVDGYPRQLFILTDGEVSNTEACVAHVRKHADTTRVFTFGIGNDASQALVKGMAKAGEGFSEFIVAGESMEDKVMKQLNRAMKPAITNLAVEWSADLNAKNARSIKQTPFKLPPLFLGSRLVVYGFIPQDIQSELQSDKKKVKVKLTGSTALRAFEQEVELDFGKIINDPLIHRLGAKSAIRDLEENRSFMHNADGTINNDVFKGGEKDKSAEIIKLSTTYGVLSSLTAFVAVEQRDEATEGTMKLRKFEAAVTANPNTNANVTAINNINNSNNNNNNNNNMLKSKSSSSSPMPQVNNYNNISSISNSSSISSSSSSSSSRSRSSLAAPQRDGAVQKDQKKRKSKKVAGPLKNMMKKKESKQSEQIQLNSVDSKSKERSSSSEKLKIEAVCAKPASPSQHSAPRAGGAAPKSPAPKSLAPSLSAPSSSSAPSSAPSLSAPSSSSAPLSSSAPAPAGPGMRNIILKQKATGSWTLSDVSNLLGKITADKIKGSIPKADGTESADVDLETLWVTAVVAAYLSLTFPSDSNNWEQVVKKAKRLLAKAKKTEWFTTAETFVKASA